jgi:hypothetical protein
MWLRRAPCHVYGVLLCVCVCVCVCVWLFHGALNLIMWAICLRMQRFWRHVQQQPVLSCSAFIGSVGLSHARQWQWRPFSSPTAAAATATTTTTTTTTTAAADPIHRLAAGHTTRGVHIHARSSTHQKVAFCACAQTCGAASHCFHHAVISASAFASATTTAATTTAATTTTPTTSLVFIGYTHSRFPLCDSHTG